MRLINALCQIVIFGFHQPGMSWAVHDNGSAATWTILSLFYLPVGAEGGGCLPEYSQMIWPLDCWVSEYRPLDYQAP